MPIETLTSPLLAHGTLKHGFFTRKGGASSGVYQGLNCGLGSDDQRDAVELNRARVAAHMGGAAQDLVGPYQVHSAKAVIVDAPFVIRPEADALVTKTPGLVISILTADCMPVLFADPEAGVIGAAHAGWRGAVDGVLENTVSAMTELGADRARIKAVIGPCISQENYEVGAEFFEDFTARDPDNTAFFAPQADGKYLFALPQFGLHALSKTGISAQDWIGACTYADEERFYSYRRQTHRKEPDCGRLISAICLPAE